MMRWGRREAVEVAPTQAPEELPASSEHLQILGARVKSVFDAASNGPPVEQFITELTDENTVTLRRPSAPGEYMTLLRDWGTGSERWTIVQRYRRVGEDPRFGETEVWVKSIKTVSDQPGELYEEICLPTGRQSMGPAENLLDVSFRTLPPINDNECVKMAAIFADLAGTTPTA